MFKLVALLLTLVDGAPQSYCASFSLEDIRTTPMSLELNQKVEFSRSDLEDLAKGPGDAALSEARVKMVSADSLIQTRLATSKIDELSTRIQTLKVNIDFLSSTLANAKKQNCEYAGLRLQQTLDTNQEDAKQAEKSLADAKVSLEKSGLTVWFEGGSKFYIENHRMTPVTLLGTGNWLSIAIFGHSKIPSASSQFVIQGEGTVTLGLQDDRGEVLLPIELIISKC